MYGSVKGRRHSLGMTETANSESSPYIMSGSSRRSNAGDELPMHPEISIRGTPGGRLSDAWGESWRSTLVQQREGGTAAGEASAADSPPSNDFFSKTEMQTPSVVRTPSPSKSGGADGSATLREMLRDSAGIRVASSPAGTALPPSPSVQRLTMGVKARFAQYTMSSLAARKLRGDSPDPAMMFEESRVGPLLYLHAIYLTTFLPAVRF